MIDWLVLALHLGDSNTWLIIGSGFFVVAGFTARRMMWLRILLGAGSLLSLTANARSGQPVAAIGNGVIVLVNVYQILRLYLDEKPLTLPPDLALIYSARFTSMTTREFMSWLRLGERFTATGVQLCRQGEQAFKIHLLLRGSAEVRQEGVAVARLEPGDLAGEMSFLSGKTYSADVVARGEVDFVDWNQDQLARLHVSRPSLYVKVLAAMGNNVVYKLQHDPASSWSDDDEIGQTLRGVAPARSRTARSV